MEDTSKKATVLIVDPPSGWRHGFPAPLQADYKQQLITAGYPKKVLGFAIKHSRYWELTVDLPDTKAIKRDQELTSPYGDNNHPLKEISDES